MDWDDLKILLAAARGGSAGRAAAKLGVSVSTITRRLAQLEEACGQPLFARTPGGLQPTEAAIAMLPHAEAAERAILAAGAAAQGVGQHPEGEVRITLPDDVLCTVVLPRLSAFQEHYPDIQLSFLTSNQVFDLSRRQVDIALRTVRPEHGDALLVRRIRQVPLGVYGTRAYLRTVSDPEDPIAHRWIVATQDAPETSWIVQHAPDRITLRLDSAMNRRLAAACDLGAVLLPSIFAELTPGLVALPIVLPLPAPLPLYAITHRAVRHAPAVSAVWAFLVDWVGDDPDRDDLAVLDALHRRHRR
ncbi:MAG TPA: LysR family transcriptional regulator [Deltaproteobacteria bacterium]|nr:LysR family transcriptional regulator [Deltaproteobacteria bacterium]